LNPAAYARKRALIPHIRWSSPNPTMPIEYLTSLGRSHKGRRNICKGKVAKRPAINIETIQPSTLSGHKPPPSILAWLSISHRAPSTRVRSSPTGTIAEVLVRDMRDRMRSGELAILPYAA
ncbi:unnamed protein product, partial [Ceratitis capitata]